MRFPREWKSWSGVSASRSNSLLRYFSSSPISPFPWTRRAKSEQIFVCVRGEKSSPKGITLLDLFQRRATVSSTFTHFLRKETPERENCASSEKLDGSKVATFAAIQCQNLEKNEGIWVYIHFQNHRTLQIKANVFIWKTIMYLTNSFSFFSKNVYKLSRRL